MNGPRRLALTDFQRSRVEHALAGVPPEALSAGYDVIDPANLAMVNGFAFGVARGTVAELVGIIDALTAAPSATVAAGVAVVTGPAVLSAGQLAVVLCALADAEVYREREGSTPCLACIDAPPSVGLCAEHGADFDAAQAYHDLSAGLTGGAS